MRLSEISGRISEICPVYGVNSEGVISFKDEATQVQKDAASAMLLTLIGSLVNSDSPWPTEKRIRDWEFRDRFTETELDQIISAAYAGDTVARRVLMKIQTASDGVNLMSVEVIGGLDYLVAAGVLTIERKDAILS